VAMTKARKTTSPLPFMCIPPVPIRFRSFGRRSAEV
jgi:hypothetical protein